MARSLIIGDEYGDYFGPPIKFGEFDFELSTNGLSNVASRLVVVEKSAGLPHWRFFIGDSSQQASDIIAIYIDDKYQLSEVL